MEAGKGRAKRLLARYGLPPGGLVRAASGFTNEVWLSDGAVVKLRGPDSPGFARERWFYRTLRPAFAPKLLADGEDFLLLERVRGAGLFRCWPGMDAAARRDAVRQIAAMVREMDAVPLGSMAPCLPRGERWREAVAGSIADGLKKARAAAAIPPAAAADIARFAARSADALGEREEVSLVYSDLHFDNLLMEECGRLRLIDFERIEAAPRDLVLDVPNRMTLQPFLYANEEDEPFARREDYRELLRWLAEELPAWFASPRLPERLALYGLRYDLECLLDYPNSPTVLERIFREIRMDFVL